MAINSYFYDYQTAPPSGADQMSFCSPGLQALQMDLRQRWGTASLGCFGQRAVRGGSRPSTHSYGAAIDVTFKDLGAQTRLQIIAYLVSWSAEWGVQAIHDYQGSRIWRAGRTPSIDDACTKWWRAQRASSTTGMGQSWAHWIHIEIHPTMFHDGSFAQDRGIL